MLIHGPEGSKIFNRNTWNMELLLHWVFLDKNHVDEILFKPRYKLNPGPMVRFGTITYSNLAVLCKSRS